MRHKPSRDGRRGNLVRRLSLHGRFVMDAENGKAAVVERQAAGCAFFVTMARADGALEEWVCSLFLSLCTLCAQVYDAVRRRFIVFNVATDGEDLLRCRITSLDGSPSDAAVIEVSTLASAV